MAKLFTPKTNDVGDVVVWTQNGYERMGEVWAKGPEGATVWVVPAEPYTGEQCVLVYVGSRKSHLTGRVENSYVRTTYSQSQAQEAA